jgi:hypothetical protein
MMVATVDLHGDYKSTPGETRGLWLLLQQIVGLPFLFFHQSYGEELTLHLGAQVEPRSAKLQRRARGSCVLTFRASVWTLVSEPQHSFVFADTGIDLPSNLARRLELNELEEHAPIEAGSPVVRATPFLTEETGGFGLLLSFADESRLMIRPVPATFEDQENALPEIADWELFTPFGRYLRVGPGRQWEYLRSRPEEAPTATSNGPQAQGS